MIVGAVLAGLLINVSVCLASDAGAPEIEGVRPEPVLTWGKASAWALDGDRSTDARYEVFTAGADAAHGRSHAVRVGAPAGRIMNTWDVQLRSPIGVAVKEGDRLLARFWVRCADSMTGQALLQTAFERAGGDYDKSVLMELTVGREWKRFDIAFEAHDSFAPGEAQLVLQLGFETQQIEVTGGEVWTYGKAVALDSIPSVELSYPGRDADAPWRTAADERIERLRKGDLVVRVKDAAGQSVAGAEVEIEMTRHAFPFGTAVAIDGVTGDAPDDHKFREVLKDNFNYVVFENAMKWNNHGIGTPERIDQALAWFEVNGLRARGHVLVWPAWRYLPEEAESLATNPAALRELVNRRVTETAALYRGRLTDWDVINETVANTDLMDVLGYEEMTEWFRLAQKADPEAGRYLNDYAILTGGARDTGHQDRYFEILQGLIDQGAPITGIGMQGHFGANVTGPERLLEILDRFAQFGLPIRVTEFDMDTRDEALQGDYMRDFVTAMFSHPAVDGVLVWGFWANRHWRGRAAMFRADWSPRPQADSWRELIYDRWWTRETGRSGDDGAASFRGFKGDYDVVVTHAGKTTRTKAVIGDGVREVEVTLP